MSFLRHYSEACMHCDQSTDSNFICVKQNRTRIKPSEKSFEQMVLLLGPLSKTMSFLGKFIFLKECATFNCSQKQQSPHYSGLLRPCLDFSGSERIFVFISPVLAKLFKNVLLCLQLALGSNDPCLTCPKCNGKITHSSGVHYLPCGWGLFSKSSIFKVVFNLKFA